jgi:c-di-GMP-binding flagellar brake protein YcgR
MTPENPETSSALPLRGSEITDPAEIAGLLAELSEREQLLFCRPSGGGPSFVAKVVSVDAGSARLRVTLDTAEESGIHVGGTYEILARMEGADLVFATSLAQAVPGQPGVWDLSLPSRLQPWRRREHPRGSCLGLVDVILCRKDAVPCQALKARLRDISNAGLGMALPHPVDPGVRAGDILSDCVLLINAKPMATCAIEIVYTRPELDTGNLLAGGRFVNLDEVAEKRIAKLIETLDPLWGDASNTTGGQTR